MNKSAPKKVSVSGHALLHDPLLNKGSAFTEQERDAFGLHGLLPHQVLDMATQAQRVYTALCRTTDPLDKYVALAALQDRNEHLYFYVLQEHLEEFLPIVYTPTIGLATKKFSQVFQRGRGAWITPAHKGKVAKILRGAARGRDIRLIVATDNESVLGIGDQGVGGIKISIGKLSLYTAAAGIDPARVLPISLDVGTNNDSLLSNPGYLGWPHERLRGEPYDELIEEFVTAVHEVFPKALLQWEDFRKDNALRIMDRYRQRVLSFNDDIQGTGAVALAGILTAERIHGRNLIDERFLILGAGAAGLGISREIKAALRAIGADDAHCRHAVAALDSRGLIVNDGNISDDYKAEMAWSEHHAKEMGLTESRRSLEDVCDAFRPTVLIGTSGQRGAFSEQVIRQISELVERPLIFPLSNPTDQSEADPADVYKWTNGKALVAAGSPFPDVEFDGKTYQVGQGNNAFVFPGIGLGAILADIREISDEMFFASAKALAAAVTQEELDAGLLYPTIDRLYEVSGQVARAVMVEAVESGLAREMSLADIDDRLRTARWCPDYREYERS